MALESGTKLGHYQVTDQIGKGGMGEVYRARDTKLGREVAIKTLPAEFAEDPDRLARFEREAKLLASLNHPNIAAIYGLEEHEGSCFLVLELVEGPTMADRLRRGAIPAEESLKLALQIAEALEAAHEKGVVHRDLKPANIKITPDGKVKVLDFGLAKALAEDGSNLNLSNSPTISMAATQQGVILGTAAYMSPEQAKGRPVDKRTDIWAFGCVLFEMLAGRGAFGGEDVSTILARVLERQPDYGTLPANLNPRLRELLERCLEKDPGNRWHDIADVRVDIEKVLVDPVGLNLQPAHEAAARSPSRLPWAVAAVGVVLAALAGWVLKPDPPAQPRPVTRFYETGETFSPQPFDRSLAVSPDGRYLAYKGEDGLYLRMMGELGARRIQTGSPLEAAFPVFSPDGQWVGFLNGSQGRFEKVAISGGPPVPIGRVDSTPEALGVSWGADDALLFVQQDGIYSLPGNGGTPKRVVASAEGERLSSPQLLPDGKGILFTVSEGGGARTTSEELARGRIVVQPLDPGAEPKAVWNGSNGRYLPTGHLIYTIGDALYAISFDLARLEVAGSAVSLTQGIGRTPPGAAQFDVSDAGTLVYVVAPEGGAFLGNLARVSPVWVDRQGNEQEIALRPDLYVGPRLSADGTRLAISIVDLEIGGIPSVWTSDLTRTPPTLTRVALTAMSAVWTPDSERIVFGDRATAGLSSGSPDGTPAAPLGVTGERATPGAWTREGRSLVFTYGERAPTFNIGVLSMADLEWEPLFATEDDERHPAVSPDGTRIAYASDRDGERRVYVERFPGLGERVPISPDGADSPVWSGDGDELFYRRSSDGATMVVEVRTDPTFTAADPSVLIEQAYRPAFEPIVSYDYDSAGRRFLMLREAPAEDVVSGTDESGDPRIVVVENWFTELRERVPAP